MWRRQRRCVLDFRRRNSTDHPPYWPSTARLWRESAALNSWGSHHGGSHLDHQHMSLSKKAQQRLHFLRRLKEQVSHHPSSPHSTGAPLRVCWPAASLSGTGTAVLLTVRPSSDSEHCLQRSSVPLSHPSWTFLLARCSSKTNSIVKDPTHPSHSLFQLLPSEDGTGASEPAPPDCSTAFYPRLWEPWTQITPPPSETPCKPLPPETWTPPLQTPPNLTTPRNTVNFFCAIQVCYTQVSGPVQTTCSNTLSSMH